MTKLTLIDRAFFLKKTPLFGTLDLDLLLAIADKLQILPFQGGQTIFRIDEEAFRMYFIVEGVVEIHDDGQKVLAVLKEGDFFGEESFFNEQPRAYEAKTQTDCVLLGLSRTNLLTIISECPSVAVGLLQAYSLGSSFRPRPKPTSN